VNLEVKPIECFTIVVSTIGIIVTITYLLAVVGGIS